MNKILKIVVSIGLMSILSACPNVPIKDHDSETQGSNNAQSASKIQAPTTTGLDLDENINASKIDNPNCNPDCVYKKDDIHQSSNKLATKIIYFDFDKSKIKEEFIEILNQHALYLTEYPKTRIRLEGHTDERGSREYNVALGEKRAKSVKRHLQLNGVSDDQISTVSFGEELPEMLGHSEDSWSQNRRTEIVYE